MIDVLLRTEEEIKDQEEHPVRDSLGEHSPEEIAAEEEQADKDRVNLEEDLDLDPGLVLGLGPDVLVTEARAVLRDPSSFKSTLL